MINQRNRCWDNSAQMPPFLPPPVSGAAGFSFPGGRMGRRRKAGKRHPNGRLRYSDNPGIPSQERMTHGAVERLAQPIADPDGRPVTPYRCITLLLTLERKGAIKAEQLDAGETFRERFFHADFASLNAAPFARNPSATAGSAPSDKVEKARLAVYHAIVAVGGLASVPGSCIWNVIGWDRSLNEWALAQGCNGHRITPAAAQAILLFALADLVKHYRLAGSAR